MRAKKMPFQTPFHYLQAPGRHWAMRDATYRNALAALFRRAARLSRCPHAMHQLGRWTVRAATTERIVFGKW
jgi:hypothetical protein